MIRTRYLLILLIFISGFIKAQDLSNLEDQKAVDFSGGVNVNITAFSSNRESPARDPFVWTLSGSPTLSLYGISIPFSFVISQKQRELRQPFNQFGLSPTYKWLTVHGGYRNITFSRYTLAGHTFLGGGIEANPGKFRFGFVYGRFLKAVEDDSLTLDFILPAFKRNGYALKIGYGDFNNYIDLIVFHGKDDTTSIDRPSLATNILPEQNIVFGIRSAQNLLKIVNIDLDFGLSAFTRNLYADSLAIGDIPLEGVLTNLTTINNSTQATWAGNATASVRLKGITFRLQYRRIEPEFQSMGAYFFNNDLENITFGPSFSLLKRRMNVRASVGWQRNNLFNDKVNRTFRRANSLNVNYSPSRKLNMSVSWTNFQIEQSRNPIYIRDFVDSLQLQQFSNNLSAFVNLNLGNKDYRSNLSLGTNYQTFEDNNNFSEEQNSSVSLSPTLSYRFNNTLAKYSLNTNFSFNSYNTPTTDNSRWGITVGGNKRFWEEKLRLSVNGSLYQNFRDQQKDGSTNVYRGTLTYVLQDKHDFSLRATSINRNLLSSQNNNINEFLGSVVYNYRF